MVEPEGWLVACYVTCLLNDILPRYFVTFYDWTRPQLSSFLPSVLGFLSFAFFFLFFIFPTDQAAMHQADGQKPDRKSYVTKNKSESVQSLNFRQMLSGDLLAYLSPNSWQSGNDLCSC